MTLKELLEKAWNSPIFFPCHIVIWSGHKWGRFFGVTDNGECLHYAKGRKSSFK